MQRGPDDGFQAKIVAARAVLADVYYRYPFGAGVYVQIVKYIFALTF